VTGAQPPVLTGRQRLKADAIAGRVLEQLQPGCGPMVVSEWASGIFASCAQYGPYRSEAVLYSSTDIVVMTATFFPGGTLHLSLEIDNQNHVWDGVLRGPARAT